MMLLCENGRFFMVSSTRGISNCSAKRPGWLRVFTPSQCCGVITKLEFDFRKRMIITLPEHSIASNDDHPIHAIYIARLF